MTKGRLGSGVLVALALVIAPVAARAGLQPVDLALGGIAWGSSSINYTSSLAAIDGIDGGDPGAFTATLTGPDFHSWWQVDIGAERHIGTIEIQQRTDCCQENMFPFVVIVADFPLIDTDITDADGSTYPGVTRIVVSDAPQGKYVVPVHRPGRYVMVGLLREYTNLSLGEVRVFEEYNAAINRFAKETTPRSTTYTDSSYNANDNNVDGNYNDHSVAVAVTSASNKLPYYDLQLDAPTAIGTVDLWTTNTTCCSTVTPRPTFTLIASPTALGLPSAALPAGARKFTGNVQGAPGTVYVGGVRAQYIRVQLEAVDALSIAEIQVWPVARGTDGSYPTISSKAYSATDPFSAIDFNLNAVGNDITPTDVRTAAQTDPYYEIDLGADRYIDTVTLWGLAEASTSTQFSVWTSEFNKLPQGATVDQLRANQLASGAIEFPSVAASSSTPVSIAHRARWIRVTIKGASQVLGLNELEVYTTEGYVASPLNGLGGFNPSITGYHSRPNEPVDVYAFKPGANPNAGFLTNWTYVGTGISSAFAELTPNAIAPLYQWTVPSAETFPSGLTPAGGMLGVYAQAYVNPLVSPIVTPLQGLSSTFDANGNLVSERDPFWPHLRVASTSATPDGLPTPPPYLTYPMGTKLSTTYYNLFSAGSYRELPATLAQFNSRYLATRATSAKYFNKGDLGIGRKMTCATPSWTGGDGSRVYGTACAVSNYAPPVAAGSTSKAPIQFGASFTTVNLMKKNAPPFATVVMVKRQGVAGAMFGVYAPSTTPPTTDTNKTVLIQSQVFLDSTGANTTVPNNCMACHGGSAGSDPLNLNNPSMFLPFDPQSVDETAGSGFDWTSQEESFRSLNQIVSLSQPTAAITDFITGTYHGKVGTSGTKADPTYVPAAWSKSAAQKAAYDHVIKPYCRGCHMSQTGLDLLSSSSLEGLRATVLSDVCVTHKMPHSQVTMKNAWTSEARATLLSYFGRDDLDQNTIKAEACKP